MATEGSGPVSRAGYGYYWDVLGDTWRPSDPKREKPQSVLERLLVTVLTLARVLSLSNLKFSLPGGSRFCESFMDVYVLAWVSTLGLLLWMSPRPHIAVECVVGYEIIDVCLYRLFFFFVISRNRPLKGRLRRSLLLGVLNLFELVLGFAVLYFQTGAVGQACSNGEVLTRTDALYFSAVTILTVGYGDLRPCTVFSKRLVLAELGAGFLYLLLLVPALVSGISDELSGDGD